MPADTATSATLLDLMLRVGRAAGVLDHQPPAWASTDNRGRVPDDPYTKTLLTAMVNNGYALFLRSDRDWSFCEFECTLTLSPDGSGSGCVEGRAWEYALPRFLQHAPITDWEYLDQNSTYDAVVQATLPELRRARREEPSTGAPRIAAFVFGATEAGDVSPVAGRVLFHPTPDQAYELAASFRIATHRMVELTERHVAGADHDEAIFAAAMYLWALEDGTDDAVKARWERHWKTQLAASIELDTHNRPVREVNTVDPTTRAMRASEGAATWRHSPGRRLYSVNGTPIEYDD
jgi:hypothetical protein